MINRYPAWMATVLSCIGIVLGCFANPALGAWVSTGGPVGGLGYDVRIHPGTKAVMYVTDNNAGVIKSEDAGKNWRPSNTGITVKGGPTADAYTIFSLTIDPNDPSTIWAGTNGDSGAYGIFKSTNGGDSWSMKNNGISDAGFGIVFRGFTIKPGDSNIVYAQAELPTAVQGREFNRVQGRVYKTENGGDSWTLIWQGDNLARYLLIDPTNVDTLYLSTGIFDREANNSDCATGVAGAGGVGVLKSTDGGATWNPINTGLTDFYVGSLRMHPSNPSTLFAATGANACSGQYEEPHIPVSGLFKTIDGGSTWSVVIPNKIMTTVNFSPSNPSIMYAGSAEAFYSSTDGGETWTPHVKPSGEWGPIGVRAGVPIDVTIDPDNSDILYANNYGGGVFRSTDGAATWEIWSKGYSGADIHNTVIADSTPTSSSVFAIGRSGPYKSGNYGVDWTGIGNGAANFAEWYSVAVQPCTPNVVLLADEHQGCILRSSDGGNDFTLVFRHPDADASNPATREGFKTLVFAPSEPNIVYVGLAKDRGTIGDTAPNGQHVLYKSTDGGANFPLVPPSDDLDGLNIYRLTVSEVDADTLLAATSGGIYKSIDGAVTWAQMAGLGTKVIMAVTVNPDDPTRLIASEKEVGIWISTDGGDSWSGPHNAGFTNPNPSAVSLVFDPADSGKIYAADYYSGVYRSTDGGNNWSQFPDNGMSGLTVKAVKDLAFADGVLYAATQGGGVFRHGGPQIVPSPAAHDFGNITSGSTSPAASITIYNTGSAARSISGKVISGSDAAAFTLSNDTCPEPLPASSSCTVDVTLTPGAIAGAKNAVLTISSDDSYAPTYAVALSGQATLGKPASISVPASDFDGSFQVSWAASATAGVTYVLQEATNSAFTGAREAYSGTNVSAAITGRLTSTTYYYQVKAIKGGHADSDWRAAGSGCSVTLTAAGIPASITVPATDADGSYAVQWAASATAGASYVLREATNSGFTTGLRTVYSGPLRSVAISGRTAGTKYYYQVKAIKAGYIDSAWRLGGTPCAVAPAPPASITVPVGDADGKYTVSWGGSITAGVSYIAQESTSYAFSTVTQVSSGTGRSVTFTSPRATGKTYYYRAKAMKSGYPDSGWKAGASGCAVPGTTAVAAPVSLTFTATILHGYTVNWATSATVGVTYILEEAMNSAFTTGLRTAYTGTAKLCKITNRVKGLTYYYRVRAIKAGAKDSAWRTGNKVAT